MTSISKAGFEQAFEGHGLKLPLRADADEPGSIVDANGAEVLVIDVNRERPDRDVISIAFYIALAVNRFNGVHDQ